MNSSPQTNPLNEMDLQNLDSMQQVHEALMANCVRYEMNVYRNRTSNWVAKLVGFQGYDERGADIPNGYVQTTGLTVGGQNVMPGTDQSAYIQAGVNCLATRVKCSAWLINRVTGNEVPNFTHDDHVATPGKFFCRTTFGIQNAQLLAENKEVVFELTDTAVDQFLAAQDEAVRRASAKER